MAQVHTVAAHQDPLFKQELALQPPLREAPVGADDAMPREVIASRRKNEADEPRGAWIDVAIGAHKSGRDGAHAADDPSRPLFRASHVYIVT